MNYTVAVITVSDKGFAGLREDLSGPVVRAMLVNDGFEVVHTSVVPDDIDAIKHELLACAAHDVALVITTGGTGFSPRDVTPEATIAVCERLAPGIGEAMRAAGMSITNRAMLSREQAGLRGRTLIVNLPGSPKAARENLAAVLPALPHALQMLRGKTEH